MTTTYASLFIQAGGQDFLFSVNGTDGSEATMVNLVSGQGIGDTFSTGSSITKCGPCILNSSAAAGASKSILGAVLLDPNNNVVAQFPYVDPETAPIPPPEPCAYPVGLNYRLVVLTANA